MTNMIPEPLLQYADEIIVLESGRIIDTGSYESIIREPDISARALTNANGIVKEDAFTEQESKEKKEAPNTSLSGSPSTSGIADHTKRNGTWSVYEFYYESAGFTPFTVFIFFTLAEAFCSNFTSKLLVALFL